MDNGGLTAGQIEVANAFFDLIESQGFVVAGGAALVALGLSTRPTQDLDVFTSPPTSTVVPALRAFEALAVKRSWYVSIVTAEESFCRFVVDATNERVLVDLAIDSAQSEPATITVLGPTMAAEEVAARKLLALFDRGAARDYVDVYQLAKTFGVDEMLSRAAEIDLGFDRSVLADAMAAHGRFADDDFHVDGTKAGEMRVFFDEWSAELSGEIAAGTGAESYFSARMKDSEYAAAYTASKDALKRRLSD